MSLKVVQLTWHKVGDLYRRDPSSLKEPFETTIDTFWEQFHFSCSRGIRHYERNRSFFRFLSKLRELAAHRPATPVLFLEIFNPTVKTTR